MVDEEGREMPDAPPETKYFIGYPFTAIPSNLWDEPNEIDVVDIGFLCTLAYYARPHLGRFIVWPSVETLAKRCKKSVSYVVRAIRRLQSLGYIKRRRRIGRSSLTELLFIPYSVRNSPTGHQRPVAESASDLREEDV